MADSAGSKSGEEGLISRRQAILGALTLAAGSFIATRPDIALANVGDAVHIGDDLYGKQTSFQVNSTGAVGGTSIASSFVGRNANAYPAFPVQGLGSVIWSSAPAGSSAVWGDGTATNNYGVHAVHDLAAGIALKVDGRTSLKRSGIGTVSKGSSSKTVTVASGVNSGSKILVTLQGNGGTGVYLKYAAMTSATTFKVYLSKACTKAVRFSWMVTD
jgi:hypothetical protein